MGIIRKTLSITTLGLVGWKSNKELLAEAEAELATTRADLEQTSAVRSSLQERLADVEKRLTGTELLALKEAKAARKAERRRHRADVLSSAGKEAEARAAKARKEAEARAEEARAKLHHASKSARRSARKAAKRARKRAEHLADDARHQVDDVATTVRAKVRH